MRLKQQQRASGTSSPLSRPAPRSPSEFSFRTEVSAQADAPDYLRAVRVRLEEESIAPEDEGALESLPLTQGHLTAPAQSSRVLADIFEKVKGSIGSGLVQVGNVLGARAEKALTETSYMLPLYSTVEMNEVMSKKYDLLNELSQSCMLLGEAQEKEKEFNAMRAYVEQLEGNVRDLNDALENAAHTRDSLQFKCKAAETEASVLKAEQAQDREVLSAAKSEAAQCQQKVTELVCELAHKEKCVAEGAGLVQRLTAELQRYESALAEEVQKVKEEGAADMARLQSEQADRERAAAARLLASAQESVQLESKVQSLTEKLSAAERDRDHCMAELEVLQEMAAADKQSATSEFARLREAMASQQYLYKEQLIKQDAQFHALKRELSEAQAGLATITDLHHSAEHEKAQLKSRLSAASAEIHQLTTRYAVCQGDLRSAEEAVAQQKALAEEAQTKLKEQQVQLVVSASEHGMLSDQAKMAELTVSALHSEIAMLRREIDEQRDLTKIKNIEVMTAISKYNTLEESQLVLKAELEEVQRRLAQNLQDNQEEVSLLEGTIAALREDSATQGVLLQTTREAHAAKQDSLKTECTVAMQQKQSEIDALQAQHNDLLEALGDLKASHEALKDAHSALQLNANTSQSSLAQEVVALKRALADAEEAFASSLQLRDSEITSVRSKSDCVESTLALVRTEMSRVVAEYKAEIQRKDSELVALVESRDLVTDQLEAQSKSFEEALQVAKQRYDQREKDFISALRLAEDTQDSRRSELHQQLAESREQYAEQTARAAELQQKLSTAELAVTTSTEKVDRLGRAVGMLSEELTAAKAEIAELETKETASSSSAKQSAAALAELRGELATIRETHATTLSELEKAKTQLRNAGCDSAARAVAHEADLAMLQVRSLSVVPLLFPSNIINHIKTSLLCRPKWSKLRLRWLPVKAHARLTRTA
jgi:chromosome segregation ATPase